MTQTRRTSLPQAVGDNGKRRKSTGICQTKLLTTASDSEDGDPAERDNCIKWNEVDDIGCEQVEKQTAHCKPDQSQTGNMAFSAVVCSGGGGYRAQEVDEIQTIWNPMEIIDTKVFKEIERRDPQVFSVVLNYLRTGGITLPTYLCGPAVQNEFNIGELTKWILNDAVGSHIIHGKHKIDLWKKLEHDRNGQQHKKILKKTDKVQTVGEDVEHVFGTFYKIQIHHVGLR
ncbi:hypothetical protein KUTeg_017327 [Tegillarca granosa]|uniref:Potassium channel tetramerisation-type BTB domain-containing protein n=1 Tax=Tegillarca granosa TaxID=220873 RepID=A0ABQ9EIK5_TEGGR|nr:hypothetical protein KUTeg_017327 [Tegillarca granosa]